MSLVGFPLLLIPLAIYNIIVFLMPGVSIAEPIFKLTLMSGAEWPVSLSDMLLATGLFLLLLEIIKGAKPGAKYLTDHLLSLIVFGAAAAEFLLWPRFGSSTYFLLALLSLVDFLSGVALRTKRRVPLAAGPAVSIREAKKSDSIAETRIDPVVAAPLPAAASVAESVLSEPPEPRVLPPLDVPEPLSSPSSTSSNVRPIITVASATHEPSPEITSAGLQPIENTPSSPGKPSSP